MFGLNRSRRERRTEKPSNREPVRQVTCGAMVEPLESRQLLSATLSISNADILPGPERLIFNRIQHPNTAHPNVVHDKGTLVLHNTGNQTLSISSLTINGPWRIVGTAPKTIAAGHSANLTLQFTATTAPAYTYNQTNYTNHTHGGGTYIGSLTIHSNDPAHPTQVEQLAGWWQDQSENNEEPNLQTIINLISNYKTNIASGQTPWLKEGTSKQLYGEEVNSAYWRAADPTKAVTVRQLASFHTQGNPSTLAWYAHGTRTTRSLFVSSGAEGQSFLPHLNGHPTSPAAGSFSPGSGVFGFKIDYEWSDDTRNYQSGGGHHIRFYPVRDHNGNLVPNSYFMVLDYSVQGSQASSENFDFQDQVYLVFNARPAGNA